MKHINLNLRLRPIRFAFLVHPDNQKQVLKVFRTNTCLWGGKFNPIIPIHKNEKGNLSEKEKQVVKKYLDFFEPDFIVEAEQDISKDVNFERVISIDSILKDEVEQHGQEFQHGQSVKGLYKDVYETEFKSQYPFNPNDPSMQQEYSNIIHVKTERDFMTKSDQFKNFVACNFGDFPEDEGLKYFRRNYTRYLFPSFKTFRPDTPDLVYNFRYQSPLDIGCKKLKINYSNNEPSLFLLDVEDNEDLIDFWNLRGVCSNIKAVPVQYIKNFSPHLKEFVKKHYPAPEINEIQETLQFTGSSKITQPVSIFSRSISNLQEVKRLYKHYIQYHYNKDIQSKWETTPDLKKSTEFLKTKHCPILEAEKRKVNVQIDEKNPKTKIDLLSPGTEKSGECFLWANIITIQDLNNQIATAFPCNYRKNFIHLNIIEEKFDNYLEFPWFNEHPDNYPLDQRIEKTFLSTTEGLVVFSHYKNSSERWILMDGITVIANCLKNNKSIETTQLSDAGRTTQQIIRLLGFEGISSIANNNNIKLLNEMSTKQLKSCQFQEFQNKVKQAIKTKSKGYSNRRIRCWLNKRGIEDVIPSKSNEIRDLYFNKRAYKRRNVVERCIGWLKELRRIATRYEKLAVHYLGMVKLGMILQYLKNY